MSDGNGKINPEQPQPTQSTPIEMRIVAEIGKPLIVHFPFLADKCATYGFLKLAEKTLDAHYEQLAKSAIVHPKRGIMDFVRRK